MAPKDITEILNYSSGIYVSVGSKGETSIKIRGLSRKRTLLLLDGIPLYEPYFNSFNINLIPAEQIKEIKIIKGSTSVLYGANTLGGIINIITKRFERNFFSLNFQLAPEKTYYLAGNGGFVLDKFSFLGSYIYDTSDGFYYYENEEKVLRENSDYDRKNFIGKLLYYPNENAEILTELFYTKADYGIPPATEIYWPRYWRFSDWERIQFNVGGSFNLFNRGIVKIRNYYIKHYNVLDGYTSSEYREKKWVSTYDNYSLGSFILSSFDINNRNELNFSLYIRKDNVKTQADKGAPFKIVKQNIISAGIEDYFRISSKLKLIGGLSFDYLDKEVGEDRIAINPLLGFKYTPCKYFSMGMSYSNKARFPTLKSLYSSRGGNPDLHPEVGRNVEVNFNYNRHFRLGGALFYNKIWDMIISTRSISGYHMYENIGEAEIKGFEVEFGKTLSLFDIILNFTYLKTKNFDTGEPLDLVPEKQFNFVVNSKKVKGFILSFWGVYCSDSQTTFRDDILHVPAYFLLNFSVKRVINDYATIYVKGENILDNRYFTEPGFPMKSRTFSIGLKLKVGG